MSHKPKDMELWHQVARSAKPLRGRDRHAVYSPLKQEGGNDVGGAAPRRKAAASQSNTTRRVASDGPLPSAAAKMGTAKHRQPCLAHGEVAGVDRRTAERMKRGRMQVEARLDLHGLTQAEAHRALDAFVAASYDIGRRCVLVITGKGQGKQEGGVLRGLRLRATTRRRHRRALRYVAPQTMRSVTVAIAGVAVTAEIMFQYQL